MKKKTSIVIVAIALFAASLFTGCAKKETVPTLSPEITQTGTSTPDSAMETPVAEPTQTEQENELHEHIFTLKELPPTCMDDGKTWEECACGAIQNETILPATGHGELFYTVVTEPSAQEEGFFEELCEICGMVLNSGSIPKSTEAEISEETEEPAKSPEPTELSHQHVWVEKITYPACEWEGKTWEECACGEIRNEVITASATGHSETLEYVIVMKPTMEEEGEFEERCPRCGLTVNSGILAMLEPTPLPTNTPVPPATSTPKPTPTPKPTSTPTPKPTNTPVPTATPASSFRMTADVTELVFTTKEPQYVTVTFEGSIPEEKADVYSSDAFFNWYQTYMGTSCCYKISLLDEKSTETTKVFEIEPKKNGTSWLKCEMLAELADRTMYDQERLVVETITITVNIPEFITPTPVPTNWENYDPAEDGYPYFLESKTCDGITAELWVAEETSTTCVLVFSGQGTVTKDILYDWECKLRETSGGRYKWKIEKIYFGEGITEINTRSLLPTDCLRDIYLPSTLKIIGETVFKGAKITELIVPEGVEEIKYGAFYECGYLEKVTLPSTLKVLGSIKALGDDTAYDAGSVFNIGNFFTKYENKLLEITIPKSVEYMGYSMFGGRHNLVIYLEEGIDTSKFTKGWDEPGLDGVTGWSAKLTIIQK